jgi:hypothetical protein
MCSLKARGGLLHRSAKGAVLQLVGCSHRYKTFTVDKKICKLIFSTCRMAWYKHTACKTIYKGTKKSNYDKNLGKTRILWSAVTEQTHWKNIFRILIHSILAKSWFQTADYLRKCSEACDCTYCYCMSHLLFLSMAAVTGCPSWCMLSSYHAQRHDRRRLICITARPTFHSGQW